jgi:thioredoxin 1
MKRKLLLSVIAATMFMVTCRSENRSPEGSVAEGKETVIQLTNEGFKKMIFNYEANKEWKYEGTKPAIIDFYADWCGPCRQLSPMVDEVAKQYDGKIIVYKVNTDKEQQLSQSLGISGLPTLLFIPASGKPQMSMGLIPKESLIKAINEVLMVK